MARRRAPRNEVPASVETLFGRDGDRDRVRALLESARLVTLTGPGGIGKTSLAREVARGFRGDSAIVACELEGARDLEGALGAIAGAWSIRSGASARGAAAAIALAKKVAARAGAIVLLDNIDAVVGPVATFVRACLDAGTDTRFVVTSREPLGIEGEHVVALEPLAREDAVAMFEARARGGRWKREEVELLVDQLDGIPLCIELAARRARLMPPGELVLRLDQRFRLLKSDRRDVAERHATLAATIAWSWERLTADEQKALICLGLFEGQVTLEAFESVVGPLLDGEPLDAVEALIRKSWVTLVAGDGPARVTMLRTLRAFARERLPELRGGDEAEARHARFYLAHAESAASRAYGPHGDRALDTLEAALPDLLAIFTRERRRAPAIAARLTLALSDLVLLRNVIDLRSSLFADARGAADASGDPELQVRARTAEAKVILEVGPPAEAAALLAEAIAIADGAGLDDAGAAARRSLGWALLAMGNSDDALTVLERALARHRVAADVRGQADALAARGLLLALRGAIAEGHRDFESAHALHLVSGDVLRRDRVIEMARMTGLDLKEPVGESREDLATRLRASADAHRASGRLWREALDRLRLADLEGSADTGQIALARKAAADAGVSEMFTELLAAVRSPDALERKRPRAASWTVGAEARWLRDPSGTKHDLARHGPLRRVIDALVTRRLAEPGAAIPAHRLVEAGWPGERANYASAMLRVYSSIRRVRALGLGSALLTRDDGYLLDPEVAFERA